MKYFITFCICIGFFAFTGTLGKSNIIPEFQEDIKSEIIEKEEKEEEVIEIESLEKIYENKDEISIENTIVIWSWKGGDTVKLDQLKQTITAVQKCISIPSNEHTTLLLLETSAVESSRGIDMIQKGGSARGILQMMPSTERFLKKWLKKHHPSIHKEIISFYNNNKSVEWNRSYNVPYQIAMSLAYYWHKCGDKLPSLITTREDRAKVWKRYYNTYKGKGTISKYHEKAEKYL